MGHHDPEPLSLDALARDPGRARGLSAGERGRLIVQAAAVLAALGATLPTSESSSAGDRLLKVGEAAHMLGCSGDSLYRNRKHPARVQNGRSVRFSLRALESFIRHRQGRAAS